MAILSLPDMDPPDIIEPPIHVRDSVKQIDKTSWLVGSKHILRHGQGPRRESVVVEDEPQAVMDPHKSSAFSPGYAQGNMASKPTSSNPSLAPMTGKVCQSTTTTSLMSSRGLACAHHRPQAAVLQAHCRTCWWAPTTTP